MEPGLRRSLTFPRQAADSRMDPLLSGKTLFHRLLQCQWPRWSPNRISAFLVVQIHRRIILMLMFKHPDEKQSNSLSQINMGTLVLLVKSATVPPRKWALTSNADFTSGRSFRE